MSAPDTARLPGENVADRPWAAPAKIRPQHLERLAVVYVRQSSPRQVLSHKESTELQYKLARRGAELGWPPERVLVIDDDLGQSAATPLLGWPPGRALVTDDLGQSATTPLDRAGFQRLLAEISLNHVGLVLGIEMSRLARSCLDWYQLLEVCALFGVLLADQEGLYDPAYYNDRLLLGLKGTMSEAELHLLRSRMEAGRLNKAQRGELFNHLPIGYVRGPSGEVIFDPDEQVQAVVRLVFAKFAELGSCRRVLDHFLQNQIRLPVRPISGPARGQLAWRVPSPSHLYTILRHPMYAGAYTHGRSRIDPRRKRAGHPESGRVQLPMDQWRVVRRDALPAFISWEQYLANRERLRENGSRFECRGVARGGAALLAGLVVCGRCGCRMYSHYNHTNHPRYVCNHFDRLRGPERCPILAARLVDELVSCQVLRALEPAALALSLQATEDLRRERERLDQHWQQQVERARYQAERAKRQYDAVEPENRLVARTLERRWEQALLELRQAEEEYERFRQAPPRGLTAEDRAQVEALARDIPSLWAAPTTTHADRQEVIRRLVERVVVTIRGETEVVGVAIHWAGGRVTEHELIRAVGRYEMLRDYERLRARVKELRESGFSSAQIAERINEEGFRSPQQGQRYTKHNVRQLLSRWGLSGVPWKRSAPERLRGKHEWWANELVESLGVPLSTLCMWCRRGWVHARRVSWPGPGRWLIWADAGELRRLRRLKAVSQRGGHPYPTELTTPKSRPEH